MTEQQTAILEIDSSRLPAARKMAPTATPDEHTRADEMFLVRCLLFLFQCFRMPVSIESISTAISNNYHARPMMLALATLLRALDHGGTKAIPLTSDQVASLTKALVDARNEWDAGGGDACSCAVCQLRKAMKEAMKEALAKKTAEPQTPPQVTH